MPKALIATSPKISAIQPTVASSPQKVVCTGMLDTVRRQALAR